MPQEQFERRYRNELSRNYSEGGYTFLHRVFRTNIDSGEPAVINTGNMYFQYGYAVEHTTFEQGISLLEGDQYSETNEKFMCVIRNFRLNDAIAEGGYYRRPDGRLTK